MGARAGRLHRGRAIACAVTLALAGCGGVPERTDVTSAPLSRYDEAVLADDPVGYWVGSADLSGNDHDGAFTGAPDRAVMPNGDTAPRYDGVDDHLTIPDAPALSVRSTGVLTIEAWLRPDTLQFRDVADTYGYVHWLGKGSPGEEEYVARMYSLVNLEDRPNRISGYAFNPEGGEGAGSHFEDPLRAGEWIHYALVIDSEERSPRYPTGSVEVYRDGRLRDKDPLSEYGIVPRNGGAPLRVATKDADSFFEGAVGKVAVYGHRLTPAQLRRHYRLMVR